MNIALITPPATLPVSLADAKHFLRILEDDDDDLITSMIESATDYAQNFTNRQFVEAVFELTNDSLWQDFAIPKDPVISIDKIEVMDESGVYQEVATADYYAFVEYGKTKIHFETLPSYKDDKRAVKITFTAGYDTVPSSIISYIKVLVSTMYENRELYVIGASVEKFANPLAEKMLSIYRVNPI